MGLPIIKRQLLDGCGAAQPKWLRTATRRYHLKYRNQKPLERTQDWIKLGGKARHDEEKALILEQAL
ncbi:hypothetical protein HFN60_13615 [Rhizobium leguminosarum]|uniref:hypothetical protein n=1 Tax=Rhizobium leguminosarum TaxID=384 RepID=UPI001C956C2A|nr:hypothetical protein [Rhizobium leguminosarum]MBY5816675.1 hypothetical protein [Rhizobium leguminosarum]